MRRNLNETKSIELWTNNDIGRLGYISNSYPHIALITYDYGDDDDATNTITSYSSKWHKIIAMRKNLIVSLCVNGSISVDTWQTNQLKRPTQKTDYVNKNLAIFLNLSNFLVDEAIDSISFNPDDFYKVPRTSTKVKKNEQPLG
tara:strand:- start:2763 stop:3194 length:432 start_codon:yes stop_codon:yes gene_type:complete